MLSSLRILGSRNIAKLNHDVLDQIVQACPTGSLVTLSLVSSYFYSLALPHMLRVVALNRDPEQLISFIDFIVTNEAQRSIDDRVVFRAARYVNKLVIGSRALFERYEVEDGVYETGDDPQYPVSTWAPTLTHAMSLMLNLQSFAIEGLMEDIATHSTDFAITVLTRPRLTCIDLSKLGLVASSQFAEVMTSGKNIAKLKMVGLESEEFDSDEQRTAEKGMGNGLFHSREHLTEIHLRDYNLQSLLTQDTGTLSIFPNVQTLNLRSCLVFIESLATAFPALRNLFLDCDTTMKALAMVTGFQLPVFELSYLKSFSGSGSGSPHSEISFPNLVSVEGEQGELLSFFNSIGSSNHVRRVVVKYILDLKNVNPAISAFALTQSLPLLQSLHFSLLPKPISWWTTLATTLPHLTYLAMSVFLRHDGPDVGDDPEVQLANIPRSLASVPLIYISLNVLGLPHVKGVQAIVTEQAIALIYAQNIPTLHYIDVREENKGVGGLIVTKWWRIVRGILSSNKEVDVSLKVLEEEQGMALKKWYDLEVWK